MASTGRRRYSRRERAASGWRCTTGSISSPIGRRRTSPLGASTSPRIHASFRSTAGVVFADPYVILRATDNRIFRFGSQGGQVYDSCPVNITTPFLNFDKPASFKFYQGFDAICSNDPGSHGTCRRASTRPRSPPVRSDLHPRRPDDHGRAHSDVGPEHPYPASDHPRRARPGDVLEAVHSLRASRDRLMPEAPPLITLEQEFEILKGRVRVIEQAVTEIRR